MNLHLFYRLAACSIVESCCTLPLATFVFVRNFSAYTPWEGLEELHSNIGEVRQWPYNLWVSGGPAQMTEWYQIGCGIIFFLLLGLNRDARSYYKRWLGLSNLFPDDQTPNDPHLTSFMTVSVDIPHHPETIQVIA